MATLANISADLKELQDQVDASNSNLDQLFLLIMGIFVLFMQGGFAFLEAGSVRSKNTTNILMKNILDVFIGAVSYYLLGYAFSYGQGKPTNGFIGFNTFAASDVRVPGINETDIENVVQPEAYYAFWFYQFVFAATASTIVSGSVAERTEFIAYLFYCVFLTGFIYPIVAHWAWSETGWLASGAGTGLVFQDFAGSAVVHITGGTAAFVGAVMVGPRIGRFKEDGTVGELNHHSITITALGAFVLYIGFMAFNGGSQLSISSPGDGAAVSKAIVNTILGGAVGGMTTMAFHKYSSGSKQQAFWSCLMTINGGLAGMVALCAGCDDLYPWAAMILGFVAGVSLVCWHRFMLWLKVDDPLDAVAVHFGGGMTGILLTPIFATNGKLGVGGIIFSGHADAFRSFGWNLAGALAIIAWVGATSLLLFGSLRLLGVLRVSELVEIAGLDGFHHGEDAYPLSSYSKQQLPVTAGQENGGYTVENESVTPVSEGVSETGKV